MRIAASFGTSSSTVSAAWAVSSGRELTTVRQALKTDTPSVALLTRGLITVRAGRRALWAVTGLSIAISFVQLFRVLDDPSALGPILATLLLSPLYACGMDILGIGRLEHKLLQRAQQIDSADTVLHAADASTRASVRTRTGQTT